MSSTVVDLDHLQRQLDAANTRMTDGDWSLWRELLSHRDDVAILGAYGACVTGWEALSARFARTADGYAGGGGRSSYEHVISWTGADLACSVTVEKHESRLGGTAEPVTFLYRATHVFRREDNGWKIVLRHADPLARFVGPQVSHELALAKPD
ncbi:MAG TPA: hypothetical protein VKQ30_01005 [Ktedonobacterales bacterium]|nr:hypothetical protein [Ktedonobacterales bacterium]